MLNTKRITKTGSITVPAHLRRELGIESGEKFEIERENGNLSLKRISGRCIVCKSSENLIKIQDVFVCEGCATIINESKRASSHE